MNHKAFAFDWKAFDAELRLTLEDALRTGVTDGLIRWIEQNRDGLVDPYEGKPLPANWRALLESGDVHELGDIALTRFYRPKDDAGLSGAWLRISDGVPDEVAAALLGFSIGPEENPFDPGRMGSYFQSPEQVRDSVEVLRTIDLKALLPMRHLLEECLSHGLGAYVTF